MMREQTKDINVLNVSYSESDRYLKPTRSAIDAMKATLERDGQFIPISVYPITSNKYRLIAGATRFTAASELGWKKIHASIWSGSSTEFKLLELIENVQRRELTAGQRKEMKAKIKELQAERLASVVPSKGGRGNKGGVREQARQMGLPKSTAHDRSHETKPPEDANSRAVSDPPPPSIFVHKVACGVTEQMFQDWQAWCDQRHLNIAEGLRLSMSTSLEAARNAGPSLRVV